MNFRMEIVDDIYYLVIIDEEWGTETWFKSTDDPREHS